MLNESQPKLRYFIFFSNYLQRKEYNLQNFSMGFLKMCVYIYISCIYPFSYSNTFLNLKKKKKALPLPPTHKEKI